MTRFVLPTLDKSWIASPLGKLASIKYGSALTAESRIEGNIPVYGSGGLVGKHNTALHDHKSIVIGRKGSVGAIYLTDGPFWCIDTAYFLNDFSDLINIEYLAAYLEAIDISQLSISVAVPGLNRQELSIVPVPLPTMPEQEYIVEVLDQAETVGNLRKKAQDLVNNLAKQRFTELFGHPAENPKNFDCFTLDQFGSLDRGVSKHRPRDASHLFGGSYPFIQTGEVANAGDWITSHKSTYSDAGLAQSKLWPKGTLCITIAANIAKAAILEFDACFPDSVVGFTPFKGISSEYVLYCIRFYQEYFEHKAPKAAQMNINLETLRTLRIPRPPESLQREFADFVRQVRLVNQSTTEQFEKHNKLLNELKIAAFSGELTAAWREANSEKIAAAVAEREELLHKKASKPHKVDEPDNRTQLVTSKPIRAKTRDAAQPQRQKLAEHGRPARHWLINELSEFQSAVWTMLRYEWRNSVIVDDPEAFNDFCTNPQTTWPIELFNASPNRIRRTLEQLAALGLIAKISVPRQNTLTQQTEYLTAFRPLRDAENTRLRDAETLKNELKKNEQSDSLGRNSDKWGSWS